MWAQSPVIFGRQTVMAKAGTRVPTSGFAIYEPVCSPSAESLRNGKPHITVDSGSAPIGSAEATIAILRFEAA